MRRIHDERALAPLVLDRDRIAERVAGEAALRAQAGPPASLRPLYFLPEIILSKPRRRSSVPDLRVLTG